MEILLIRGALYDIKCKEGYTALHRGVIEGRNDEICLLLRTRSNPNLTDDCEFTALHHAVSSGKASLDTIRALHKGGACLDSRDNKRRTPLMLAAQLGNEEKVAFLLSLESDDSTRRDHARQARGYTRNVEVRRILNDAIMTHEEGLQSSRSRRRMT